MPGLRHIVGVTCLMVVALGCQIGSLQVSPTGAPGPSATPLPITSAPLPTVTPSGPPATDRATQLPSPTAAEPSQGLPITTPPLGLAGRFDLTALTWETITDPFGGDLEQVVSGMFLGADDDIVAWGRDQEWVGPGHGEATTSFWSSADGSAWTKTRLGTLGDDLFVRDVAAGPAGFAAVGTAGDQAAAWFSTDGTQWQRATVTPDPTQLGTFFMAIAGGPDGFLAVGSDRRTAAAWFSSNGTEWRRVGEGSLAAGGLSDVVAAPDGRFITVGVDESHRDWDGIAWRVSRDGREWRAPIDNNALTGPLDDSLQRLWVYTGGYLSFGQQIDTDERIDCYGTSDPLLASVASIQLASVCYWGPSSWRAYTSEDGREWMTSDIDTEMPSQGGVGLYEYSAIEPWGDGLIAVGAGTDWQIRVWLSADGVDWMPIGAPVLVNDLPAPLESQRDTVDDLLIADDRLIVGGRLGESDGFVMIGRPAP